MNLINKTYTHPVLRPGYDDVSGTFIFVGSGISVFAGVDKYVIDIAVELKNPTIEKLIEDGKAKIYAFIHCKGNFYRNAVELNSFSEKIEIPVDCLTGRVEMSVIVSAATGLSYKNSSQHADYGGSSFGLACGDILAVSEERVFYADRDFDSLKKIESIISINADKDLDINDPLNIDSDGDKIRVTISKDLFEKYMMLKRARMVTKTLETLIFLPILVSIIIDWRNDPDYESDNQDHRWFRAIYARAAKLNIIQGIKSGIESPFVLAQSMLEAPFSRCLDEVTKKWQDSEEGDGLCYY